MARRLKAGGALAQPIRMASFAGGEASVFSKGNMPPKYSLRLQNCYWTQTGGIGKTPGFIRLNEVGVGHSLTSGHDFKKKDGTVQKLVAGLGNIYKVENGTATLLKSGLNPGGKVSFATFNDLCIMCNGYDAPLKYDGTSVATLGGSPPATAFKVHVHKNRVWFLEKDNRLQPSYSALNDPEDWTTPNDAGYLDFSTVIKSGDEVLDVFTFVDLIVFFLRNHILIYSGNNPNADGDFKLTQVIGGCGVVAEGSVQELGTDCAFLYDSGVKNLRQVVTTGNLTDGEVSKAISPDAAAETKAGANSHFASAHFPELGWYMLLVNGKVRIYSYQSKAWSHIFGADIYGMFNGAGGEVFLLGNGFLYQFGKTWTFDGSLPVALWETAWMAPSSGGNKISPKDALILCKQSGITTINLDTYFDDNSVGMERQAFVTPGFAGLMDVPVPDVWDNCFLMDGVENEEIRLPMFGEGRAMKMVFSEQSDKGWEISDIIINSTVGRN